MTSSYVDTNLYHDQVTGRALTAILHMVNSTPVDWYRKRQNTEETATYESEFVAAKTAIDQIIDLRLTLRYLGVPICKKSYLFGDNRSVIDSSTFPTSSLKKRHLALAYCRVRDAIASTVIAFHWICGSKNPADILSKHWAYSGIKTMSMALLLCRGDTLNIKDNPTSNVPPDKGES